MVKKLIFISICFVGLIFTACNCNDEYNYYKAINLTNNIKSNINKNGFYLQDLNTDEYVNRLNLISTNTKDKNSKIVVEQEIKDNKCIYMYYIKNNKIYNLNSNISEKVVYKEDINNSLYFFRNNINKYIPYIIKNNYLKTYKSKYKYKNSLSEINIFDIYIPEQNLEEMFMPFAKKYLINKTVLNNVNLFDNINNLTFNNIHYLLGINSENYIVTQNLEFQIYTKGKQYKCSIYSDLDYINEDIKINF